jgi:tripartite-type tricarboxylate transporter receptor subunit TctC
MKDLNHSPARRQVLRTIGAAAAVPLLAPGLARAQNMPEVTRLVVGFPAGNPVEAPGRALAQALQLTTGRTYLVFNRPGVGGILAASEVAKAKPDGSTMIWVNATHTINPSIYKKLPFDAINDFTPISQVMSTSGFALVVGRNSPYRTVQELIKAGQEQPGKIGYASLGNGNTLHLLGELFGNATKAKFLHVPYSSSPFPDVIAGHVAFTWMGIDIAKRMVDAGDLRVLAVTSKSRIKEAPNAPTYAEMGIQGIDVPGWGGVVGPRGMAPELAERIHKDIAAAVKHESFQNYVKSSGDMQIIASSPAEFGGYIRSETDRLRKMIAPLGLALDAGF